MNTDFDFQEWASLAKTDPEAFEQRRLNYIDQFLSGSGKHRRRLEGLQFKIDAERKLAHTPEKALVVISKLMVESLNELGEELKSLSDETKKLSASEEACAPVAKELPSCKVIYLLPRHARSLDEFHV